MYFAFRELGPMHVFVRRVRGSAKQMKRENAHVQCVTISILTFLLGPLFRVSDAQNTLTYVYVKSFGLFFIAMTLRIFSSCIHLRCLDGMILS